MTTATAENTRALWTEEERREYVRAWLALSMIQGLGDRRRMHLLEEVRPPMSLFSCTLSQLTRIDEQAASFHQTLRSFDRWDRVDEILRTAKQRGLQAISLHNKHYPPLLREIADPPALLWVWGNVQALNLPSIAMVGTRRPSKAGSVMATNFARDLVCKGRLAVVSGLATGVDTFAHEEVLRHEGVAIAVLGSGHDRIYPRQNRTLAQQIVVSGGALVSEYPPGTGARAFHFPRRNRIISGLSLGTLIVESRIDGGSIITVNLALDQNREVYVVPHDLRTRSGSGCNLLIQRGSGMLVTCVEDILTTLQHKLPHNSRPYTMASYAGVETASRYMAGLLGDIDQTSQPQTPLRKPGRDERSIYNLLEVDGLQVDEIIRRSTLNSARVLSALLQLELAGWVVQMPGKLFFPSR